MRRAVLAVSLLIAIALAAYIARSAFLGDFRAFYCAGQATLQHADPYAATPLHQCEIATMPASDAAHWKSVTIPAPVPPYTLPFFAALAMLPYTIAATLWSVLLMAATVAIIASLRLLTSRSLITLVCAIGLSVAGTSLMIGQLAPLAIACLCCAALFMHRGRWTLASIAAAGVLIEPHVGIPVLAALAIWAPGTRTRLGLIAPVLIVASVIAVPLHVAIGYLTVVLPAHALSEVRADSQYSFSAIAGAWGVSPATAVKAGIASYIVMTVLGIIAAGKVASLMAHRGFIVLVPAAFAVFGGTFVHLTQIAAAIPLALLMLAKFPTLRAYLVMTLIALAVPWPMSSVNVMPWYAAGIAFVIAREAGSLRNHFALVIAAIAAVLAIVLRALFAVSQHMVSGVAPAVVSIDPRLSEASWSALMLHEYSTGTIFSWSARVPTWLGLASLLACALIAAYGSRQRVPSKALSSSTDLVVCKPV